MKEIDNYIGITESAKTVEKETFTTSEAAILCGLSVERAKQYARSRGLPRFGKAFVWTSEDVDDMRARKKS